MFPLSKSSSSSSTVLIVTCVKLNSTAVVSSSQCDNGCEKAIFVRERHVMSNDKIFINLFQSIRARVLFSLDIECRSRD